MSPAGDDAMLPSAGGERREGKEEDGEGGVVKANKGMILRKSVEYIRCVFSFRAFFFCLSSLSSLSFLSLPSSFFFSLFLVLFFSLFPRPFRPLSSSLSALLFGRERRLMALGDAIILFCL